MPIYEFVCLGCNEVLEVWQKVNDEAPKCTTCGHSTKRQIAGGTDFILAGDTRGFFGKQYLSPRVQSKLKGTKVKV